MVHPISHWIIPFHRRWSWYAFTLVLLLFSSALIIQPQTSQRWTIPSKGGSSPISAPVHPVTTLSSQSGTILFDLSNVSSSSTPLTQTVQGLTATFSSPGDPGDFSIFNPGDLTIGPNILADPGPAFAAGIPLRITFSQSLSNVTMQFATDGTGPFDLSAFSGGKPVGSSTAIGSIPPGHFFPEGVISFNGSFDSLALTSPNTPYFAIANVSVVPGCQLNVTRLIQNDPRWAANLYDHSSSIIIGQKGCALTSLSMALNTAGDAILPDGTPNLPGFLNAFMTRTDADYSGLIVFWGPATRDASGGTLQFHSTRIDSTISLQAALDYLDTNVCQGSLPVIVGVNLDSQGTPGHYVLVTGKQGSDFQIADPFFAKTSLSQYGNQFVTRGFVSDPAGDISELDFAIGDVAELAVIDPAGRQTGFDPSSQQVVEQISGSSYFRDKLDDDVIGAPATEIDHIVEIPQPFQGTYQILITGLKLGTYTLSTRIFSQNGASEPELTIVGIAGSGSTSSFSVQLFTFPGGPAPTITRVATFGSTLADISAALQLGLIDDRGTANSLSTKIVAAEKATSPARNNILNAFVNELNAQTGKHVTGIVPTVLLEDAISLSKLP